jgi:preprotein translocase SecE subunit
MAIVRTTTKENTTGSAPPATAKSPRSSTPPIRPGVRPGAPRAAAQGRAGARQFLQDTWTELHRVKWPTRAEVQAGTIVTVLLLFFFAIYIFGLDYAAEQMFKLVGLYGQSHTP